MKQEIENAIKTVRKYAKAKDPVDTRNWKLYALLMEKVASNLADEVERLDMEINTPEVIDFLKAVQTEAAHQRERWGKEHDARKSDLDWFWTLGYLVNKSINNFAYAERIANGIGEGAASRERFDKALHHLITSAALLANWHSARVGGAGTVMPPAMTEPKEGA